MTTRRLFSADSSMRFVTPENPSFGCGKECKWIDPTFARTVERIVEKTVRISLG